MRERCSTLFAAPGDWCLEFGICLGFGVRSLGFEVWSLGCWVQESVGGMRCEGVWFSIRAEC